MATTSTPKSKVALPASASASASSSNAGTTERNSTFVNKPARGWLHPDYLFAKDGINYNVRVSIIHYQYLHFVVLFFTASMTDDSDDFNDFDGIDDFDDFDDFIPKSVLD